MDGWLGFYSKAGKLRLYHDWNSLQFITN